MPGSLQRIKRSGSWRYSVVYDDPLVVEGRKQRRKTFRTEEEAHQFLADLSRDITHHRYIEPSTMLFKDYLALWEQSSRLKTSTIYVYKQSIQYYAIPVIGHLPLATITPMHIEAMLAQVGKGVSEGSKNDIIIRLQSVFQYAVNKRLLRYNPCREVELYPVSKQKEHQVWDEEQVARFLEAADRKPYSLAFYIGFSTAMRLGEIMALSWKDVDLVRNRIVVAHGLTLNEMGRRVVGTPKTSSSERVIPITGVLARKFKEHRLQQNPEDSAGWVFPSPSKQRKGLPMTHEPIHHIMDTLIKELGLPRITFHGARHTAATLMVTNGVDYKTVQKLLGHASAMTTMGIYVQSSDRKKQEALESLSELYRKEG